MMTDSNFERAWMQEMERQRQERMREGWKEFYKNNPDFGKSKAPEVFSKLSLDKLGDEK